MWQSPLLEARLIRRYKRFLADVELPCGEVLTVHCPNTGAMTGCAEPGWRVWLSESDNPKRKYRHSWELVENARGDRICIHAALANAVLGEALQDRPPPVFGAINGWRAEAPWPGGRADFLLQTATGPCWLEVKSVTLLHDTGSGMGCFPDAVSQRALKHLDALLQRRQLGERAVLCFLAMHTGIRQVSAAAHIDPLYAQRLQEVVAQGVEVLAWAVDVDAEGLMLGQTLPVMLGDFD